jgi:hypothetical protein
MIARRTGTVLAAALAIAVWLTTGYLGARKFVAPPSPRHPAAPLLTAADVNAVIAKIQIIRRLKFKHPIEYRFLSTDEALAILRADAKRDREEAKDRLAARVGVMLGLLPPGTDPAMASMRVLHRQLGGFYDFDRKELVVIKDGFAHSKLARSIPREQLRSVTLMVLAHELTHALQDQNFGLGAELDRVEDEDDPALALRAVAEGDATIAGIAYLEGRMDDSVAQVVVAQIPDMYRAFAADTRDVPSAIAETFLFQYADGARFVARAYHRGGWAGVDALYRRLPTSTQQILTPSLYFDSSAPVPAVRLDGYRQPLPKWKVLDDGTYGELGLREVIGNAIGTASSDLALAHQWAGDRAVAIGNGNALAVIWMVAFRDGPAAQKFAARYSAALDRLHGSHVGHRVERHGRLVLTIAGLDAAQAAGLAPAIWAHSSASAPPPAAAPEPDQALERGDAPVAPRRGARPAAASRSRALDRISRSFSYVARASALLSGRHATSSTSWSCSEMSPPAHSIRKYSTRLKMRVSGPSLRSRQENTYAICPSGSALRTSSPVSSRTSRIAA